MKIIVGHVANGYAVLFARRQIHNVIACGKRADVFKLGAGGKQLLVEKALKTVKRKNRTQEDE